MEREIKISNDLNEISVLASFIEELGEELSLSFETTMNINLALEEAVANIIMYASNSRATHHPIKSNLQRKTTCFPINGQGSLF